MSWLRGGVVVPRVRRVDSFSDSLGVDAVWLAGEYGLVADGWQADVVRDWLAVDGDRLVHSQCGLAVPRQNGKNAVLEIVTLYKIVVQGRKVLHSSHEVKTTRKAFQRLRTFFDDDRFPELRALVESIRLTNGQEAIVLSNGGSVEFIARTKNSGRGFTVDDLILDEAQDLDEDAMAALLPTLSAAPSGDPQLFMTGTPPIDISEGVPFQRLRENTSGRRLCWIEFGVESVADIDAVGAVERANPALGVRLSMDIVDTERDALSVEAFARERLGVWPQAGGAVLFDMDAWNDCVGSASGGRKFFGVDMSPDRSRVFVGVCQLGEGKPFVEIALEDDASVLGDRLVELIVSSGVELVLIDGHSPALSIVDRLQAEGVKVRVTGMQDMAKAAGLFQDAVRSRALKHSGQEQLSAGLRQARPRLIGSGGGFGYQRSKGGEFVAALVAVTLAFYGAQSAKVKPVRKVRVRVL